MTYIQKEDLEVLSNDQIRQFYHCENISQFEIPIIKKYIESGESTREMGKRINRIEQLLNEIILDRFVDGKT